MLPIAYMLTTERLVLRRQTEADLPFIFDASQVPGFTDGMRWSPPETIAELQPALALARRVWEDGSAYVFMIERSTDAQRVGRIVIRQTTEASTWDLGFWTHPAHQGRGYGTEAAHAMIAFGFEVLHAEALTASYVVNNAASRRVLEKLGFQPYRVQDRAFEKDDRWVTTHEMRCYAPTTP
ncbi:MAG: GNAT family N-acetyltransferase [Rhodothermales bacterium]